MNLNKYNVFAFVFAVSYKVRKRSFFFSSSFQEVQYKSDHTFFLLSESIYVHRYIYRDKYKGNCYFNSPLSLTSSILKIVTNNWGGFWSYKAFLKNLKTNIKQQTMRIPINILTLAYNFRFSPKSSTWFSCLQCFDSYNTFLLNFSLYLKYCIRIIWFIAWFLSKTSFLFLVVYWNNIIIK